MAPPGVFFSLRLSQAIYAVATFALLSVALSKPFSFAVYWFVSFVSLAAFICLAKLLAGADECEGALCTVTKIVTAVVFLSYAVWVTAATLIGIEISKDNGRAGEVSQEKLTALLND
ncbi:unnamed protein product [Penicillium viridicatum]